MILYRIATETRRYPAGDLSGGAAAKDPGRWNDSGEAVLYTAPTRALAMLETTAHVNSAGLPLNKYLVELDVPDDVWARRETLDVSTLPPSWNAIPAGKASVDAGSAWLRSGRGALLVVPSAIVPEEPCVLVNPAHRDARRIRARVVRRVEYNTVLRARP